VVSVDALVADCLTVLAPEIAACRSTSCQKHRRMRRCSAGSSRTCSSTPSSTARDAAPGSGSAGRPRPQARATSSRARGPLSRRMSASGSSTASSVARTSGAPRAPASG
jgi:hypothetical protein